MQMKLASAMLMVAAVMAPAWAFQVTAITAVTGPPELIEKEGAGVSLAMLEADYQKLADQLVNMPAFVRMTKKPNGASTGIRFGINFTYGGKNRTWALDGSDAAGYTLYADLNANGDLSDDAPMKMELKDGKYTTYFETIVKAGEESYPVRAKLVVDYIVPSGKAEKELALLRYGGTRRSGEINVGGKAMKFSLSGSQGLYNQRYEGIRIDLNSDGVLDPKTEGYLNSEKFVNIGELTYEFSVDRFGRSLTLTPLNEKRPARVVLLSGYSAPDFSFVDLDGNKKNLSDLKGKVVLIDFWGTWCAPCVAAVPELRATYNRYRSRGFFILSVDTGDTPEKVRAFLAEKKISWAQTIENENGPIASLFRITGRPSYFLIDREGKIAVAAPNGAKFDLAAELAKLFAEK
jgi:thiol-disulfide isomerase/thioredoxin